MDKDAKITELGGWVKELLKRDKKWEADFKNNLALFERQRDELSSLRRQHAADRLLLESNHAEERTRLDVYANNLREQLQRREALLSQTKSDNTRLATEITRLRAKTATLTAENKRLSAVSAAAVQTDAPLSTAELSAETIALVSRARHSGATLTIDPGTLERVAVILATLEAEVGSGRVERAGLHDEVSRLTRTQATLEARAEAATERAERAEAGLAASEGRVGDLEIRLGDVTRDYEGLRAKLTRLQSTRHEKRPTPPPEPAPEVRPQQAPKQAVKTPPSDHPKHRPTTAPAPAPKQEANEPDRPKSRPRARRPASGWGRPQMGYMMGQQTPDPAPNNKSSLLVAGKAVPRPIQEESPEVERAAARDPNESLTRALDGFFPDLALTDSL